MLAQINMGSVAIAGSAFAETVGLASVAGSAPPTPVDVFIPARETVVLPTTKPERAQPTTARNRPPIRPDEMPRPSEKVRAPFEMTLAEREDKLSEHVGRQVSIVRTAIELISAIRYEYYGMPFVLVKLPDGDLELRLIPKECGEKTYSTIPLLPVKKLMLERETLVGAGRLTYRDWGTVARITIDGNAKGAISGEYSIWFHDKDIPLAAKNGMPAIETFLKKFTAGMHIIFYRD